MAAEIIAAGARESPRRCGFNEAAANGRGNPPRAIATFWTRGCFNEAAANGRGNRRRTGDTPSRNDCFNEAAANGRGNRATLTAEDCERMKLQ